MRVFLALILLGSVAITVGAATTVTIRQDELRRVVESHLQTRAAGTGVQTVVKRLSGLADQQLPAGSVQYEVILPQQWEGWGKAALALIIRVDNQVVRNLPLQAEVEGWRPVVVATRPLERGTVLTAADLALERRNLAQQTATPLLNPDELVGKRMRTAVRQGSPLSSAQVEKVMVVTSGQQVTILLEHETLQLTATGRAKSAGAVGDLIQVQNLASQKVVPARVLSAQTVQVDF